MHGPALVARTLLVVLALAFSSTVALAAPPDPAAARAYVASIEPSPDLQAFLDRTYATIVAREPKLRTTKVGVALLDMAHGDPPRLAAIHGELPIYPASAVKFVYLMAAYAWQEQGRFTIDPALDVELSAMIRQSSNQATRKVFARLTDTEPGPELPPDAYRDFRERRQAVKRWLVAMGIDDLHCVNPTYDGGGDLFGRDRQFIRDKTVPGALAAAGDDLPNRQAMTAIDTVQLLALLATDRALTPEDSATVRRRMKRDPKEQPYLAPRIAGGAAKIPGLEVYAKSGTWGPNYADAGIVRDPATGRQFAIAVFTEAVPPYRGQLIADLTYATAMWLLREPAKAGRD